MSGKISVKEVQSLVVRLLWIARCTRTDVCFAIDRVVRQKQKPTMDEWNMAKRILSNFKETKMLNLQIGGVGVSSGDVNI